MDRLFLRCEFRILSAHCPNWPVHTHSQPTLFFFLYVVSLLNFLVLIEDKAHLLSLDCVSSHGNYDCEIPSPAKPTSCHVLLPRVAVSIASSFQQTHTNIGRTRCPRSRTQCPLVVVFENVSSHQKKPAGAKAQ